MSEVIIQYVLILLMVFGIGYFIYFFRDKELLCEDDHYGIVYLLFRHTERIDISSETVKAMLRSVSDAVAFVDKVYYGDDNKLKEDKALAILKESFREINAGNINDKDIRQLIRLCCAYKIKE